MGERSSSGSRRASVGMRIVVLHNTDYADAAPEAPGLASRADVQHADLMRLASPIYHVHSGAPPFLIAHGTLDETVPFEQAERFYAALVAAGVEAEFVPLEGVYHNWTPQVENIPGREDTWKLGPLALQIAEP